MRHPKPMDEQLVLTAQTLKLSPDLQRADVSGDIFVVKNIPGRQYLTLSTEQWNLLRHFSSPGTVPDVLRSVILDRACLPLREFYELVLKAQRKGVLQVPREHESIIPAQRWPVSLPPAIPIFLALLSTAAAVWALAIRPFPVPDWTLSHAAEALIGGWVMLSFGLSLGQALAASVLKSGGGEIYRPEFRLFRPVPYFGVNLEDACMTSRLTQAGIWCARLFPVIATAAFLWYEKPEWGFLHVLGLVVMLRPFASGCVPELISTVCRGLVLDTQKNFLFTLNRRWRVRLRFSLARLSFSYLTMRLLWGVAWSLLVALITMRAMHQNFEDLFGQSAYWKEVAEVFAILAGAMLLAYLGVPFTRWIWARTFATLKEVSRGMRRWRVSASKPPTEEQISKVLAESLLFRRISPAERADLRAAGTIRVFKSMSTLQTFNDTSLQVGVVISGKLRVDRRTKAGRAERALTLIEGDVFGAHALLDPDRPQARTRSISPVVALMIPLQKFKESILQPLGTSLVNDLVQKVPFLRQVSLCASWHPQAIARFAQLSSVVAFQEGEVIIKDQQDTQQFYLIYDGQVVVKRGNRTKSRLRPGAYFGEVSILQNSAAVSDVVARETTRCLLISKADFLRFMTHNPMVSLRLEQVSSKRLGRPIFPLKGLSFEVR